MLVEEMLGAVRRVVMSALVPEALVKNKLGKIPKPETEILVPLALVNTMVARVELGLRSSEEEVRPRVEVAPTR